MTEESNNQTKELPGRERMQVAEEEINLLEYLLIILRHKRLILKTTVATFLLACVATLLMPNIYVSTARIMPPQQDSIGLGAMLAAGMGGLASLAGGVLGATPSDLYVGMLKSRTVADAIIDRFKLMEIYEQDYRLKMYEKLDKLVEIKAGKKDGIITITVEDEEPERAAAIANAYIEELKKLNVQLNLGSAGRQRVFLEQRLNLVKEDLRKAEEALKEFQTSNKAIRIDAQATAIIEAIAKLKGELASKEVELGVMRSFQTEQNPELKALREGIAQIKDQIRRLEESPSGKSAAGDIFIATADVPDLGVKYARLLREFKVQETLFELITKQYEIAKLEEAKDTSPLQILDQGEVPDKKTKPKRALIVLAATFLIGFLSVVYVLWLEYQKQMPEEERARWMQLKESLRWRNKEAA